MSRFELSLAVTVDPDASTEPPRDEERVSHELGAHGIEATGNLARGDDGASSGVTIRLMQQVDGDTPAP